MLTSRRVSILQTTEFDPSPSGINQILVSKILDSQFGSIYVYSGHRIVENKFKFQVEANHSDTVTLLSHMIK